MDLKLWRSILAPCIWRCVYMPRVSRYALRDLTADEWMQQSNYRSWSA